MKRFTLLTSFLLVLFFCSSSLTAQNLDHLLDEALVQLTPGTDVQEFQKDLRQFNGVDTECRVIRKISKQLNIYQVHFDHSAVNEFEFRDHIFRHDAVVVVQVNHLLTNRQTVPNDPQLNQQWQWINPNDADVDADLAWDISTGGTTANGDEIVVAVFDDGGDLDHPDLIDNNWINQHEIAGNGVDDDNNGYVDDVYGWNFGGNNNNVDGGGHGVNVAGMIGAVGDNNNQGVGINWDVKIMNIRTGGISEAQVIEFYSYALDHRQRYTASNGQDGAFVVATNSSWGIDGGDPNSAPLWCAFYDTLGVHGILSAGATTNQALNVDVAGDLPTACPSEYMVAVTATDNNDNRTFSGFGATTIDVGAPGDNIYTTAAGGGYTSTSGTSFASPLTAGVIGLLYSAPCGNLAGLAMSDPQLAAEQVRDALFAGAENVGNLDGDVVYGRVNAFNSIQMIMEDCGPCPAPSGINMTDLVDVQGNVNWTNPDDALNNNMRYRETGAATWTELMGVSSPYLLSGLTACTEYEIQVEAMCTDTISGYSGSFIFSTDGCCVAPSDLAVAGIANTSADASWSSIFAAESYNIRISELGTGAWTETNTMTNTFAYSNLIECTVYEVQIQTLCAGGLLTNYSESVVFSTVGCGACTDQTYCASLGENASFEWISEVVVNTLNNSTPDAPAAGYSDFTGSQFTTTLATYGTYNVTLTPGYSGQNWDEYFIIWIDYNQDGDFDDANELAFDAGTVTQTTINGTLTVPSDAVPGLTRMRVAMHWNGAVAPCEEYNFGETEDYCVTIEEGVPTCDAPNNLMVSNLAETTATLNWSSTTSIADSYNVAYRALGAATWTEMPSTATSLDITGLTQCVEYEFQVQSICGNEMSPFSATAEFLTICACEAPTDLDASNIGSNEATLSWTSFNNADTYVLRYKLISAATWNDQTVAATTITLNTLDDCSDYEYQVRSTCANSQSAWSPSFEFSTVCDCGVPTSLDTVSISSTSASLSWGSVTNADEYNLRYKAVSAATWAEITSSLNSITVQNLTDCSDYEYQVRSQCTNSESAWSASFNFMTQCLISTKEVDNGVDQLAVFPNPFSDKVFTQFTLSENTNLTMGVYTATGQLLSQNDYQLNAGQQSVEVNGLENVSQGIYFIVMTTEAGTKVRKVIKN